jgi:hypothetical protein
MLDPETCVEPEWLDWYRKTPLERLEVSSEAWTNYLALGGSLAPDPDPQSPFWSREELAEFAREHVQAATRASGSHA